MQKLLLLAFASSWTHCVASCFDDPVFAKEDIVLIPEVHFADAVHTVTGHNGHLALDMAFPPTTDKRMARPSFICLHGGGFTSGNRSGGCGPALRAYLVTRGFVAISPEYRLTGDMEKKSDGKVYLPARDAAHDAKVAVRWVRKLAEQLRLDPDAIAVIGHGAGATAALHMAYTDIGEGDSEAPDVGSSVAAVVSLAGDLPVKGSDETPIEERVKVINGKASPAQPPLMVVHGNKDRVVPFSHAKAMVNRAKETGLKTELVELDGTPHDVATFLPAHGRKLVEFLRSSMALDEGKCPQLKKGRTEL